MPDPTPTPDTLRAVIERARDEVVRLCDPHEHWRMSIPANPRRDSDLILMDALDAALAASPAPTDSPDERLCICGPDSTGEAPDESPDCPVHRADVRCVCGHMRDLSHDADGECWRALCRCDSFRPAAVTAPREDKRAPIIAQSDDPKTRALCGRTHAYDGPDRMCIRPDAHADLAAACVTCGHGRVQHTEDGVCLACESQHAFHQFLAAAAPAVERATPDPDTLAAILAKADGYPPPATAPAHYDQARALIAAGVTLNETATTPTQEDA